MQQLNPVSQGVHELIERLKQEGVLAGQEQAEKIVEDAERRAQWIIQQAQTEANEMLVRARSESTRLVQGGREALKVAARDLKINLQQTFVRSFGAELERLVTQEVCDEGFLRQLLLQLFAQIREDFALDKQKELTVSLSKSAPSMDNLHYNPDSEEEAQLRRFIKSIAAENLREGIFFTPSQENGYGIRVKLFENDIEIDLSDEAITSLLMEHLQPRFRALLEGLLS